MTQTILQDHDLRKIRFQDSQGNIIHIEKDVFNPRGLVMGKDGVWRRQKKR